MFILKFVKEKSKGLFSFVSSFYKSIKNRFKNEESFKPIKIKTKKQKNTSKKRVLSLDEAVIQNIVVPEKEKYTIKVKPIVVTTILLVVLGLGYYIAPDIYANLTGNPKSVVVSEKATRDKVFSMDEVINYNGVDYKIVKVETSDGNSYKQPKDGNEFLIVTVYIKNNTGDKISYDYKNWTMSNSKGEEKKRIFTSINVNDALYSGELVIGGIKTGSMVFEQPKNDKKLKMNFYELKKDEKGNDVIDESKRVFSVSVKAPDRDKEKRNDAPDLTKIKKKA